MWRQLRDRRLSHLKFRRQVPFRNYILDFACFEKRLVIEIDGGQRAMSQGDASRTDALVSEGFRVLRYWNNDVLWTSGAVLEDIVAKLAEL